MPDEIQSIQLKVSEHDIKLTAMDRMMTESITEQRQLVRELHSLTSKFDVYIERHDQVSEANKRLWVELQTQDSDIHRLKEIVSANQPIIDGIRNLQGKLNWFIIVTALTPIAAGSALIYKVIQ
jgi:hypothetical protein